MLYDYQRDELQEQAGLKDEIAVAAWNHIQELEQFVTYIASDYFELSQEKVRIQRDDYIRMAKELREKFCVYKKAVEIDCPDCGSDFMVTFNGDNNLQEPRFCPFCAHLVDEELLSFDDED